MAEIAQKLDQLAKLYSSIDKLKEEKKQIINNLLTPEIILQIEEVDAEFETKEKGISANIENLEEEIRADALQFGQSVKASGFLATWSKGRTTWDNKGLAEYSISHPEIIKFKKEGEPIISIRKVQDQK
jgi:hypothetical protein